LYGFNEKEYLKAFDRVPRWNRDTLDNAMNFISKVFPIYRNF